MNRGLSLQITGSIDLSLLFHLPGPWADCNFPGSITIWTNFLTTLSSLFSPPPLLPLPASPSTSPPPPSLQQIPSMPQCKFSPLANRSTMPFCVGHSAAPIGSWPCTSLLLKARIWMMRSRTKSASAQHLRSQHPIKANRAGVLGLFISLLWSLTWSKTYSPLTGVWKLASEHFYWYSALLRRIGSQELGCALPFPVCSSWPLVSPVTLLLSVMWIFPSKIVITIVVAIQAVSTNFTTLSLPLAQFSDWLFGSEWTFQLSFEISPTF